MSNTCFELKMQPFWFFAAAKELGVWGLVPTNNKILKQKSVYIKTIIFYIWGFAPYPTSFIGIKEAKQLHFKLKFWYYLIFIKN